MLAKTKKLVNFIRDCAIICAVPGFLAITWNMYVLQKDARDAEIAMLKQQIETLKESQYDKAAIMLRAQKEASAAEIDAIQRSIQLTNAQSLNLREFKNRLLCMELRPAASELPGAKGS